MDKFLTVKDVQSILKIGRNKAYKIFAQNDFPKIQFGRIYVVPECEFEKYIKRKLYKKVV